MTEKIYATLCRYPLEEIDIDNGRDKLPLEENETPSYIPGIFLNTNSIASPVHKITENRPITTDNRKKLAIAIQSLFDLRVQLFLQQLLLVYNTNLRLKPFKAKHQAGISSPIRNPSCTEKIYPLVEAHAATLPFLLAVPKNRQFKISAPAKFCWDSTAYKEWNTTVTLPDFVNNVDTLLQDRKRYLNLQYSSLKSLTADLLSGVAQNEITLYKAFFRYLKFYETAISILQTEEQRSSEEKWALRQYQRRCSLHLAPDRTKTLNRMLFLPEDASLEQITIVAENLQRRTAFEIRLNEKIGTIVTQIPEDIQTPHRLVKIFISHMLSNRRTSFTIQEHLNSILQQTSSGETAKRYIYQATQDPEIQRQAKAALEHLLSLSLQKVERELKQSRHQQSSLPELNNFFSSLQTYLTTTFQIRTIHHMDFILVQILLNTYLLTTSSEEHKTFALVHHLLACNDFWRLQNLPPKSGVAPKIAQMETNEIIKTSFEKAYRFVEKHQNIFNI